MSSSTMKVHRIITLLYWLSLSSRISTTATDADVSSDFYLPGVADTVYNKAGDVSIGTALIVTTASSTYPSGACSSGVRHPMFAFETTQIIEFVADYVNQSPGILPNVTFGFNIREACASLGIAIATQMSFLPHDPNTYNDSVCISGNGTLQPETCPPNPDVIGVLAMGLSSLTVPVSSLYSVAHLPIIGASETSDDLSDKSKHPYFFRTVPPDVYQVQSMLNFIASNRWSYISVIYTDDAYGREAFDKINLMAERYGICVATSHRLLFYIDYQSVVADLLVHSRARAVVLFAYPAGFQKLLQAVVDQNATGQFIWIGSSTLAEYEGYDYEGVTEDPGLGTITFDLYSEHVPEFYSYIKNRGYFENVTTSKNPWMKAIWENFFDCSFEEGNCENNKNILDSPMYRPLRTTPARIDAVLALAQAAHDLLADRCPNARGREARACITGQLLREYLKNTSFEGFYTPVEFDKNQEVLSKYILSQIQYENSNPSNNGERRLGLKTIGLYDISSDTTEFVKNAISWSHLNVLDRLYPWVEGENSLSVDVPESVCSGPCSVGEYKIEKEVPCCWECRRCRNNERLVNGNTSCELCPLLTWPDPSSGFTTCIEIPPTYSTLKDTIPIVLTSLTVFALVIYVCTFIGYVFYREERVIKASSKELSAIQLIAILTGYASILLFQVKPTPVLCSCVYFLFCMSFVLLYAPLLVKTVRIFRIFQSAKTNNQQLRFISPKSQVIISGLLIAVQIILCAVTFVLFSPGAKRTQPIWSEKLVELSCDLTLPGLASFLGYNIVLVALCSIFAVKVRKLPDNFNESQFIAMCVATTLLIWLAFIPTYFTANREYVRVFLISTALLLNHSIALIFLFIPKIYAAAFLSHGQESGRVSGSKS